MSVIVRVTDGPRRVTGVETATEKETLEVLGFKTLRLQLRLISLEGATSPSLDLQMEHSMVLSNPFFMPASGIVTLTAIETGAPLLVEAPLRYLRWSVTSFTGATAAVFELDGVGWS